MVAFYSPGDQELYKDYQYLPQEQYRLGLNLPTNTNTQAEAVNTTFGLPATNAFTNNGGGYYAGPYNNLIQDYNTTTKDRYFRNQDTPLVDDLYQSKLDKTFMGFPSYREQELTGPDLGEYIGSGTDVPLEQTTAGKIQTSLGNVRDKTSGILSNIKGFGPISFALNAMDQFSSLPATDQQFINMNMGYTGPTVFGENASGLSKDPFGINTRSAFGNYADYVEDYDTDYTEEEIANFSKLRQQKINFYREKQKELKEIEKAKQISDQKAFEDQKNKSGITSGANDGRYENLNDRDRGGQGAFAEDKTSMRSAGRSYQDAQGNVGYSRGRKDGGRIDYKHGGLASIL
jgi:hypothetical protein